MQAAETQNYYYNPTSAAYKDLNYYSKLFVLFVGQLETANHFANLVGKGISYLRKHFVVKTYGRFQFDTS